MAFCATRSLGCKASHQPVRRYAVEVARQMVGVQGLWVAHGPCAEDTSFFSITTYEDLCGKSACGQAFGVWKRVTTPAGSAKALLLQVLRGRQIHSTTFCTC